MVMSKKTFKHCLAFNVQPGLLALIIGCLGTVPGASRETLDSFVDKDMYEIHYTWPSNIPWDNLCLTFIHCPSIN